MTDATGSEPGLEAAAESRVGSPATKPNVVCVTPVRNEAWTLERFLRCAETWADYIVIADQGSDDDTLAIAQRSSKVLVVPNESRGYDEGERHRVVLEAARTLPGPRAIIAVDADEALSANVTESPEWESALRSAPGTVLTAEWVNYLPGGRRAWVPKSALPMGFIDDDRAHSPGRFHVERVVVGDSDPKLSIDPVKLLHFQYLDWRRMKSKQRRYQCAEALHNSEKRPVQFYRQYHRMDAVPRSQVRAADPAWTAGYEAAGIDVLRVMPQEVFPSDHEVLAMLVEHGAERFRRLDIWDVDWSRVGSGSEARPPAHAVTDPRSRGERAVHSWLASTQRRGPDRWATRFVQWALMPFGW